MHYFTVKMPGGVVTQPDQSINMDNSQNCKELQRYFRYKKDTAHLFVRKEKYKGICSAYEM
jgi:hypothetical protein